MPDRHLTERVEILEQRMDALETLPARVAGVETQLLHLRDEMRLECSAVRHEMRAADEGLRADLTAEIRAGDERVRSELRAEIRAGDEETRRYMRVLHEDVIARLAVIQEGIRPPKRRS